MIVEAGAIKITEKLTQWLELKGWTQSELAEQLNIEKSVISMWLDKESPRHPTWLQLRRLCSLTGLDIGDLLTYDRNIEQED